MKVTIDRFEGNFAVCERPDRTMININKDELPPGVKEGDILVIEGDTVKVDPAAKDQRKKNIDRLMNDIWE